MAGMTGTTKKKNLNRMDADPAREPLQDPGIAKGMEIRRKEIENARKYQADQRAKKTAPVKKATTGTPKTPYIPPIGGAPDYSEMTRPKKKATAKKDKEGEDFAKSMRKNYKKFGSGDAKTRKGKANVSKEQLDAFGGTLTQYMNQWNKTGRRPTKVSAVKKTEKKVAKKTDQKKKSFR